MATADVQPSDPMPTPQATDHGDGSLRVAVLGPIQLWRGKVSVDALTAKPRAVLSVLVAHHGRPVPVDEIVEVVWPDRPPASATNLVQKYVGQLRRLFITRHDAGPESEPLTWTRGGYQLRLPEANLDLARFRQYVAGAAGAGVADEEALLRLRAALRLWRGPSFTGLPLPIRSHPLFEAVDAEYVDATIRAATLAGDRPELVTLLPALQTTARWRPLDEKVQAHLMLALAMAGRQAEALAVYDGVRHRLVEELGIDPGPELRDAQQRVLRQELVLTAEVRDGGSQPRRRAAGPAELRRPHGIPAFLTRMHGRDADVTAICAMLASNETRLIVVTGLAGVGKTRLAAEISERMGGQWVPLAGVTDPELLMDSIVSALVGPADALPPDILDRISTTRPLLVLDNLEHLTGLAPAIAALLTSYPGLRILATSRRAIGVTGEQEWPLQPLPTPPADVADPADLARYPSVALFLERLHAIRPTLQLTLDQAKAVGELCRMLDGLPLALELAAAQCRVADPVDLVSAGDPLLLATPGGVGQGPLQAALDAIYEVLDDDCRTMLRLLATFRGGWSVDAAAALAGGFASATTILNQLASHSLISVQSRGNGARGEMLETIRRYVIARSPVDSQQPEWLHAHYFLGLSERIAPQLQTSTAEQAVVLLESDRDNIRLALDFLVDVAPGEALRMAVALYRYWLYRGRNSEGVRYFVAIFERLRATGADAGQDPLLARGHLLAANLALYGGDHDTSHDLTQAGLAGYRALDDPAGLASSHTTLSALMLMRGDLRQAVDHGHTAVAFARRCGDQRLLATSLNNLAAALQNLGRLAESWSYSREALDVATAAGDDFCADIAMHNLAENARLQGDNHQADQLFRRGVPVRRRVANPATNAHTESTWAVVKAALGDQAAAEELADSAMRNGADSGSPYGRGPALWGRAEVDRAAGRPAAAGFAHAVLELIASGYHANAVEALSGLALETEGELSARAEAAARFLQTQHDLFVPTHVQERFARSRQRHPGSPTTTVFGETDLADLLADLRTLAGLD